MKSFGEIKELASERKGGDDALMALMPSILERGELAEADDAFVLETMTKAIFRAGFSWKVVDAKWAGFQAVFHHFDVPTVAGMDVLHVDEFVQDQRIIRNRKKIEATIENARWVQAIAAGHGSFSAWIDDYPEREITSLWAAIQKDGKMLGAATGPYFVRELGKDTWLPTRSVKAALVEHGYFEREPSGKRALTRMQEIFNAWQTETGLPYAHLSRILACSTNA